jgi:hypothetical protein
VFAGAVGAAFSYFILVVIANLEDWQFYTLRSFITGKEAMSEIVAHPADKWVMLGLVLGVPVCGGLIAMRLLHYAVRSGDKV